MTNINELLDRIPRLHFRWSGRPRPAFRTCGELGFYLGLLVSSGVAIASGRSLAILAAAIAVAAGTFFGWALLRKAITGAERLVLLEHVWLALAAVAGLLVALGVPVLPYLDAMAPGLILFLAGGRAGCLLVGCCHGNPSSVGVHYGEAHAAEGFPPYLVGIRLFPVQAVELLGLIVIAAISLVLAFAGQDGAAFAWFLFSYAVLRFGLEGIRGDERHRLLGIAVPRAMCVVQGIVAIRLAGQGAHPAVYAVMLAAALGVLAAHARYGTRRRMLRKRHVDEVRRMVLGIAANAPAGSKPVTGKTSAGVTVAVSSWSGGANALHVSLRLSGGHDDLRLACELAAGAFPDLTAYQSDYTEERTVHFVLSLANPDATPDATPGAAPGGSQSARSAFRRLYGSLLQKRNSPQPKEVVPLGPTVLHDRPWFFRRIGA